MSCSLGAHSGGWEPAVGRKRLQTCWPSLRHGCLGASSPGLAPVPLTASPSISIPPAARRARGSLWTLRTGHGRGSPPTCRTRCATLRPRCAVEGWSANRRPADQAAGHVCVLQAIRFLPCSPRLPLPPLAAAGGRHVRRGHHCGRPQHGHVQPGCAGLGGHDWQALLRRWVGWGEGGARGSRSCWPGRGNTSSGASSRHGRLLSAHPGRQDPQHPSPQTPATARCGRC